MLLALRQTSVPDPSAEQVAGPCPVGLPVAPQAWAAVRQGPAPRTSSSALTWAHHHTHQEGLIARALLPMWASVGIRKPASWGLSADPVKTVPPV